MQVFKLTMPLINRLALGHRCASDFDVVFCLVPSSWLGTAVSILKTLIIKWESAGRFWCSGLIQCKIRFIYKVISFFTNLNFTFSSVCLSISAVMVIKSMRSERRYTYVFSEAGGFSPPYIDIVWEVQAFGRAVRLPLLVQQFVLEPVTSQCSVQHPNHDLTGLPQKYVCRVTAVSYTEAPGFLPMSNSFKRLNLGGILNLSCIRFSLSGRIWLQKRFKSNQFWLVFLLILCEATVRILLMEK